MAGQKDFSNSLAELQLPETPTGFRLAVRAQPRSSRELIVGVENGRLKVKLTAAPVEGAANEALCRLLAKALGLAKSRVTVVLGDTSREKCLEVSGMSPEDGRIALSRHLI